MMREVIITRIDNLIPIEELQHHPIVRKCWTLSRGQTLLDLYAPVLDDPGIGTAARHQEPIKSKLTAYYDEQAKLLAPLYKCVSRSEAEMALVPGTQSLYHFLGKDKYRIRWPEIGYSRGWEVAHTIRISGRLVAAIPETVEGLNSVVGEWLGSMASRIQIVLESPLRFEDRDFTLPVKFETACGDAVMALYMLLTETRSLTSLQAVSFFVPDDFSSPGGWRSL
jgi:hypothetical protein